MPMTLAEVAYTTWRNNQNAVDECTGAVLRQWAGLSEFHWGLWGAVSDAVCLAAASDVQLTKDAGGVHVEYPNGRKAALMISTDLLDAWVARLNRVDLLLGIIGELDDAGEGPAVIEHLKMLAKKAGDQ